MSCWCAYLVREADQSTWCSLQNGRETIITTAADRDELLARLRNGRNPNQAPTPDGYIDGAACQGFLFDFFARRHRFYPCSSQTPLDRLDQAIREAAIWQGWDAGIAFGGREELGELVPAEARLIAPYPQLETPLPTARLRPRDEWFVTWDPDRFVLKVRESALWEALVEGCEELTIITPNGTALDYRIITPDTSPLQPMLVWLREGPQVLGDVISAAPYPPATEDEIVSHRVIIDQLRSIIHYSPTGFTPARLLQAVRSAWPGWQIHKLSSDHPVATLPDGGIPRRPILEVLPLPP